MLLNLLEVEKKYWNSNSHSHISTFTHIYKDETYEKGMAEHEHEKVIVNIEDEDSDSDYSCLQVWHYNFKCGYNNFASDRLLNFV